MKKLNNKRSDGQRGRMAVDAFSAGVVVVAALRGTA